MTNDVSTVDASTVGARRTLPPIPNRRLVVSVQSVWRVCRPIRPVPNVPPLASPDGPPAVRIARMKDGFC
jgi:hypothetical protein